MNNKFKFIPQLRSLPIYQVDAFADHLFGGNPAAVIPLPDFPSDQLMQAIATENNLSETAFVVVIGEGIFRIRWFTPTTEVRLCGHATLAAAHVLHQISGGAIDQMRFKTKDAGTLSVRALGEDKYQLTFPSDPPRKVRPPKGLLNVLGIKKYDGVYRGKDDLLVVLKSQKQVDNLNVDFRAMAKLTQYRGVLVTAPGRKHDFVSRGFFPQTGIDEDPVTGSAHTLLTPYWSSRLGRNKLTARQISARGGELLCQLKGKKVRLTGQAVSYLSGQISLPVEF